MGLHVLYPGDLARIAVTERLPTEHQKFYSTQKPDGESTTSLLHSGLRRRAAAAAEAGSREVAVSTVTAYTSPQRTTVGSSAPARGAPFSSAVLHQPLLFSSSLVAAPARGADPRRLSECGAGTGPAVHPSPPAAPRDAWRGRPQAPAACPRMPVGSTCDAEESAVLK